MYYPDMFTQNIIDNNFAEYVDELMPKVFEDPRQYWEVWDQIIASPSLVQ